MKYRIENALAKKLVGKKMIMSFSNNKTVDLWKSFMPQRHSIQNAIGTNLYSVQIYKPGFFENNNPSEEFEKWAAKEVADFENIPENMEKLTLPGGLYAVFLYIGAASEAESSYRYIFEEWMKEHNYLTDARPHFEILGSKYKNNSPDSEEEIWIPIKKYN